MCKKILSIYLFGVMFSCLLFAQQDVLQAEAWYLISESELQSIEQYREKSEAEKANWLSQVQQLNMKAGRSEMRSARLEAESAILNQLLSQAREQNRRLEQSFSEYETGASRTLSQQNLQIKTLEAMNEKQAGQIRMFWAIAITVGLAIFIFAGIKVLRFFKALSS